MLPDCNSSEFVLYIALYFRKIDPEFETQSK